MQATTGNTRGGPHPLGLGSIVAGMLALLAGMLATRPALRAEPERPRGEARRAPAPRVSPLPVATGARAVSGSTVHDAGPTCFDAGEQPDRARRPDHQTVQALHRATVSTGEPGLRRSVALTRRRRRRRPVSRRLLARAPPPGR